MRRLQNQQKIKPASFEGFTLADAQAARRFHQGLPNYAETPIRHLRELASKLGVGDILVKDEAKRFGIGSFKALGASYAAGRALASRYGLETEYALLTESALRETLTHTCMVTATDGNHGCGVAWAARLLGCRARIFLPAGSAEARLRRIRRYGAEADIVAYGYDDAVRLADRFARETGGILLQDTAWEGYTEIPRYIMQGYLTMALEVCEHLSAPPTHVLLQAGVGSMAAAVAAFFTGVYGENAPKFIITEPEGAACLFESAKRGERYCCVGELHTMMAGLSCGEPSILAWEILRRCGDAFLTIEDSAAARGMKCLAFPVGNDAPIEAGESGAAGFAALLCLAEDAEACAALGINEASVLLCFNTEEATDRENYNRIVYQSHA